MDWERKKHIHLEKTGRDETIWSKYKDKLKYLLIDENKWFMLKAQFISSKPKKNKVKQDILLNNTEIKNRIRIYLQNENVSFIQSKKFWKEEYGVDIKANERPIKVESIVLFNNTIIDEVLKDGLENKDYYFKEIEAYDISQTTLKYEKYPETLSNKWGNYNVSFYERAENSIQLLGEHILNKLNHNAKTKKYKFDFDKNNIIDESRIVYMIDSTIGEWSWRETNYEAEKYDFVRRLSGFLVVEKLGLYAGNKFKIPWSEKESLLLNTNESQVANMIVDSVNISNKAIKDLGLEKFLPEQEIHKHNIELEMEI